MKTFLFTLVAIGISLLIGAEAQASDWRYPSYGYRHHGRAHGRLHDDLEHSAYHRTLEHREAHRYPMTWRRHERLHDSLDHDAYHDALEHRGFHRGYHGRRGASLGVHGRGFSMWIGD